MDFKAFKSKHQKTPVIEMINNALTNPLVSVCVMTYQHVSYIRQCLDGILMQKVDFDYEIIIGEDASTDGTREICIEYKERYPQIIQLILGDRKDVKFLFGKPIGQNNFQRTLKEVRGDYIAFCEGDDYWTDPMKLKKQIDYLKNNRKAAGCFHDVSNVNEKNEIIKESYYTPSQKEYNQLDCISKLKSSYATCSLVCRSERFKEKWPRWFIERSCDEFLDLMITQNGKEIHYLPEKMGVYRIHSNGVWQGQSTTWRKMDLCYRLKLLYEDRSMKKEYNKHILGQYQKLAYDLAIRNDLKIKERLKYFFTFLKIGFLNFRKIKLVILALYRIIAKRKSSLLV